jgi:hypothetical protein
MLLLFIYREHLHVTFLWVIFGVHFAILSSPVRVLDFHPPS